MRSPTSCSGTSIRAASCRSPFRAHAGQAPIYYSHKTTGRPPDAEGTIHLEVPRRAVDAALSRSVMDSATPSSADQDLRHGAHARSAAGTLEVSVEVANVGERAGDEVVQLYLQDLVASVTRPVQELKGFERVTLEPGETPAVAFGGATASWLLRPRMKWVVEPGEFRVRVSNSSDRRAHRQFRGRDRPMRQTPSRRRHGRCGAARQRPCRSLGLMLALLGAGGCASSVAGIRAAAPNLSGRPSRLKTRPCSKTCRSGRSSISRSRPTRALGSFVTGPAPTVHRGEKCAGCRKHRLVGFGLTAFASPPNADGCRGRRDRARAHRLSAFSRSGMPHERGWFYHFVNLRTGAREWKSELSSIDTALLIAGVLTVRQCFGGDTEIIRLAERSTGASISPGCSQATACCSPMGGSPKRLPQSPLGSLLRADDPVPARNRLADTSHSGWVVARMAATDDRLLSGYSYIGGPPTAVRPSVFARVGGFPRPA